MKKNYRKAQNKDIENQKLMEQQKREAEERIQRIETEVNETKQELEATRARMKDDPGDKITERASEKVSERASERMVSEKLE